MSDSAPRRPDPPQRSTTLYPTIARVWSVIFLVTGVALTVILVVPGWPAALSARLEMYLNLRNPLGGGAVWYAQTLAWIAIITYCADRCARRPDEIGPFYALITGKVVTTIAFAVAAVVDDPFWVGGAIVDAFIIISLVAAQRRHAPAER